MTDTRKHRAAERDHSGSMLELFEAIGQHLYVRHCMDPVREESQGYYEDRWLSLRVFLKAYAFERQGASRDYAFAAVDAIDNSTRLRVQGPSRDQAGHSPESLRDCGVLQNRHGGTGRVALSAT
jgi:hypothetical protein